MFVIKASTPEAMRNEIVKWLNQQASNHRIAASKIKGMHKKEIELARATTYEGAAKFLEKMAEIDSYKLKDNGTEIVLSKDGPNWIVDQFDSEGNGRWNRIYRNEEDARKEFERWRNY